MSDAVGIHAHPTRKLGRRPPKHAPALLLGDVLSGAVPDHPATADHLAGLEFGLYENDRFGDCGPTSVANLVRLVSAGLTGAETQPTQDDVFDLYRRSGNPDFDPATGAGDNGVDMQTMLEALHAGGIGGLTPVAFAQVDVTSEAELEAAVSIFGGVLWGVLLEEAQQTQTDSGEWDYSETPEWGGHAVLNGAYESGEVEDVITWAERVKTTLAFRDHQLEEAWVVVWPWNLDHPAFQQGIDVQKLADAYQELTGDPLPLPEPAPTPEPPPEPIPAPTPPPPPPAPAGSAAALAQTAIDELRLTSVTYQYWRNRVAQGTQYIPPDGSATHWGKALAALEQIVTAG